jgi:alkylhydroperoxidase family enzyme
MEEADVSALRDAGLSDAEILDVCQVAAYYNYVNRMADGLGVELEPYWERRSRPRPASP